MTQWKITSVIVIILFSMGLPLLIVGYVSAGEDAVAMIAPGWFLIGVGAFVAIVAAAIGMGFGKGATTSEQDTASKNWWEGQSE